MHPIAETIKHKAEHLSSSLQGRERGNRSESKEETVHYLVDQWATLNLGRTVLTGLSALLATWAAVARVQVHELQVFSEIPDAGGAWPSPK